MKFKPGDFEEILQAIPDTCILIGGQAVAWWAEKYRLMTPEGERVDANSKDIDFWGNHADLFRIADRLKRRPYLPNKRELTFFVGAIGVTAAGNGSLWTCFVACTVWTPKLLKLGPSRRL